MHLIAPPAVSQTAIGGWRFYGNGSEIILPCLKVKNKVCSLADVQYLILTLLQIMQT
jgi:hypothetical protein